MYNLTEEISVSIPDGYEIFWQKSQFKVILFIKDIPVSFINLSDNEANLDDAKRAGIVLLRGGGIKLS